MWKVKVYRFTLIFGLVVQVVLSIIFSEVKFIYDCPLKWTGLFPWNLVHGLLLYVDKAKQTFQIGPHYGLHLHLVLGHQREQQKPSKDQGRPSSLRNAKRMNLASINQSIEYISGISNTYIQVRPNPTHMKINARQNLCNLCILGISWVLFWKRM